jgi:hypothetical protein
MSAQREAALAYHGRGLAPLPIQPRGKEPHYDVLQAVYGSSEWTPLRQRPASVPEIRAWFERDPDANIGVILGRASGGLVVVDVDHPDKARALRHPPTPASRTDRGWHLFFRSDAPLATERAAWGEVRGEGSIAVLPPSLHESGHEYAWALGLDELAIAPFSELQGLKNAPSASPQEEVPLPVGITSRDVVAGDGSHLARLDGAVRAAMDSMGVHVELGSKASRKFHCILPGHGPDRHPSANLLRGHDRIWRYRDWHARPDQPERLTLAEVRASRGLGRVIRLKAPSQARFYKLLFYEAGLLSIDVEPLWLPRDASANARRVAQGFAVQLAIRSQLEGDHGPAPFTRKYAAAWCCMTVDQARAGTEELRDAEVLISAGTDGRSNLYAAQTEAGELLGWPAVNGHEQMSLIEGAKT